MRGFLTLVFALLSWSAFAADSTLPSLSSASTLTGAETVYCVQGGADKKCTANAIANSRDVNIFPITCGTADDSASINAAIDLALASFAAGNRAAVYFPVGNCTYVTPHAVMTYPVSFFGAGSLLSTITLDPSISGNVFAWSGTIWDANINSNPPNITTTLAGVHIHGISIRGDLTSANQQNAIMFLDGADFVFIDDLQCYSVPGKFLSFGESSLTTRGWLRESRIRNVQARRCGLTGVPTVTFTSGSAGGDTTNSVMVHSLNIISPAGVGLYFANNLTSKNTGLMDFFGVRIEAGYDNLLQIGDGTSAGAVSSLNFSGLTLVNPASGKAAISFQAANSTVGGKMTDFNFSDVNITTGSGNGIDIEAGKIMVFRHVQQEISGTNLIVGPASQGVGGPIIIDKINRTASIWTTSIDATSTGFLFQPTYGAFP